MFDLCLEITIIVTIVKAIDTYMFLCVQKDIIDIHKDPLIEAKAIYFEMNKTNK